MTISVSMTIFSFLALSQLTDYLFIYLLFFLCVCVCVCVQMFFHCHNLNKKKRRQNIFTWRKIALNTFSHRKDRIIDKHLMLIGFCSIIFPLPNNPDRASKLKSSCGWLGGSTTNNTSGFCVPAASANLYGSRFNALCVCITFTNSLKCSTQDLMLIIF